MIGKFDDLANNFAIFHLKIISANFSKMSAYYVLNTRKKGVASGQELMRVLLTG